jgi:alkyl sulfatase BDS1-like metallo-beta-lactamase superfamily hydrolase
VNELAAATYVSEPRREPMSDRKDATSFTERANAAFREAPGLDWESSEDFEFASRGFIARLTDPVIRAADGRVVWDLDRYDFLERETAPPTANPALWRHARLNMLHGLFKVTDRIYQVRGHDLSVVSFIEGDTGYIVIDPLISTETARASLELVYEHVGERPVVGVIHTHNHIDHWGGVKGVTSIDDVTTGRVRIIVPEGFLEAAVRENVLAGNAMSRRTQYMFGLLLPADAKAQIDDALGKTLSKGTVTLIAPTDTISETGTEMTIDGVQIVFQVTPGTEAPAEMNFYFPQFRALCMAENCSHNLHNLYTLRGAEVRDAKTWAHYLNEAIDLFAHKSDLVFTSHHWPVFGTQRALEYMKKQRDMYKYIHDQTLRLANHGLTMLEIAESLELPPELANEWFARGFYGSVNHNAKAVYQRYLGFFDGNPANLHPLPPEDAGKKYVEYMGGADAVLTKARAAFAQGDYRWVAQVVNHLVFADPDNEGARSLQADALEQLGYTAESAAWRNVYLTGAQELRDGVARPAGGGGAHPDVARAMTVNDVFDLLAVRLNGPDAAGKTITLNLDFVDIDERYTLTLENAVLNATANKHLDTADATVTLTKQAWTNLAFGMISPKDAIASDEITAQGESQTLAELFDLFDRFEPHFNIVTP